MSVSNQDDPSMADRTSLVERFAALPEPMQEHLLRLPRLALGMSGDEKAQAQVFLVSVAMHAAEMLDEDLVPAAELVTALARVVKAGDEASGDQASWLVEV